nr:MAG TPA: hypothetical protein [Caudoviricetes sp.]
MERATQKDERGYYLVGDGIYSDEGTPEKFRGDDVDRLAAYEDTGLEPCDYSAMAHALEQAERAREDLTEMVRQIGATGLDRLRELAQADREGRCVVLPLKPGDTIYTTRWFDKVLETCTDSKGKPFKRERFQHKVVKEKFSPFHLDYTEFGKSVFKTREEADAALRREQDKKGGSSE